MAGTDRPRRPPGPQTWSTAPVVLVIGAGALSVLSPLLELGLDRLGGTGQFFGSHYLLTVILVLAAIAGGMALSARRRRLRKERPRSKVIPFPEHKRRRGA